ncbi:hypothetical protein N0V85_009017, partial [Neurospora sp. IMI 360204]
MQAEQVNRNPMMTATSGFPSMPAMTQSYGAAESHFRFPTPMVNQSEWISTQGVYQNMNNGSHMPMVNGSMAPEWTERHTEILKEGKRLGKTVPQIVTELYQLDGRFRSSNCVTKRWLRMKESCVSKRVGCTRKQTYLCQSLTDHLQTLQGHSSDVGSVAFSPDGQRLASGSVDETIKIWDPASGSCLQTLEGHSGSVSSVAFSPDGQRLASGSYDDTIKIWDPASGSCLQTLEGHSHCVDSVAFSPDGQRLASGSRDSTIKIWDPASGSCLQTLEGHSYSVDSVAFSPDGQRLASGSSDETIKIWDPASG